MNTVIRTIRITIRKVECPNKPIYLLMNLFEEENYLKFGSNNRGPFSNLFECSHISFSKMMKYKRALCRAKSTFAFCDCQPFTHVLLLIWLVIFLHVCGILTSTFSLSKNISSTASIANNRIVVKMQQGNNRNECVHVCSVVNWSIWWQGGRNECNQRISQIKFWKIHYVFIYAENKKRKEKHPVFEC